MRITATFIVCISAAAHHAEADVLLVPSQYPTIQAAAEAASNGDTILVSPGTYNENLFLFTEVALTAASADPAQTILAGTIQFDSGSLNRFRVTGLVTLAGTVSVNDCEFVGNGFDVENSTVSFSSTVFRDCANRAINASVSAFEFTDCVFVNNTTPDNGGAMLLDASSAEFQGCRFEDNSAGGSGGAVATSFASQLVFNDCEFILNTAGINAGAILSTNNNSYCEITDCTFDGNSSNGDAGAVAMRTDPEFDPGSISLTTFRNNSAGPGGGAVWFGAFAKILPSVTISTFCSNTPAHIVGPFSGGGNTFDTDCPNACPADVNQDGVVSPADFGAWITAFNAMSAACDQNGDSLCTPADFGAWITNFNAGC